MPYRLDALTLDDPVAGKVQLAGDGFAAAGELSTLLVSPSVQRWLGMTPDEIERAQQLDAQYRDALRAVYAGNEYRAPHADPATRDARAQLARDAEALLGPERAQKLARLSWRIRGGDALVDDDVAAKLALSPEQRAQIADTTAANERDQAHVLEELRGARLAGHDALEQRGLAASVRGQQKLLALLTPEQRARFAQLQQSSS